MKENILNIAYQPPMNPDRSGFSPLLKIISLLARLIVDVCREVGIGPARPQDRNQASGGIPVGYAATGGTWCNGITLVWKQAKECLPIIPGLYRNRSPGWVFIRVWGIFPGRRARAFPARIEIFLFNDSTHVAP